MDEKLTVRFPAGHPVLKYPPGQRSQRVRELVDAALRLETILSSIDNRLARMESMLLTGGGMSEKTPEETRNAEKMVVFDIEAFTEI